MQLHLVSGREGQVKHSIHGSVLPNFLPRIYGWQSIHNTIEYNKKKIRQFYSGYSRFISDEMLAPETKEQKEHISRGRSAQPVDYLPENPYFRQRIYAFGNNFDKKDHNVKKKCFYCGHDFTGIYFVKPVDYDCDKQIFTVEDVFCTANCVKSSIREEAGYSRGRHFELLTLLLDKVYDIRHNIPFAPCKRLFTSYACTVNKDSAIEYEEWRKNTATVPTARVRSVPFVRAPLVIEYKFQDMQKSKMADISEKLNQGSHSSEPKRAGQISSKEEKKLNKRKATTKKIEKPRRKQQKQLKANSSDNAQVDLISLMTAVA